MTFSKSLPLSLLSTVALLAVTSSQAMAAPAPAGDSAAASADASAALPAPDAALSAEVEAETAEAMEPEPAPEPEVEKPKGVADFYGKGMRINLNEDGSAYFRMVSWHQVWLRHSQLNPNTTVNGRQRDSETDIALRRARLLMFGQFHPRFMILTHIGINNQTFNNARKPQLFVHEAVGEFIAVPKHLHIGGGLHYVNGISRMSNTSTISFLALDAPITNWPTIETSDQFARQLGIYARGSISKLEFQLSVNKPFQPTVGLLGTAAATDPNDGSTVSKSVAQKANVTAWNPYKHSMSVSGYFNWQVFDQEFGALPYFNGTYLGKKKILSIGAGFRVEPSAMAAYTEEYDGDNGDLEDAKTASNADSFKDYPLKVLSADVNADLPLGENGSKGALTAYAVYYHYDFGPNYVRNVGIMNIGNGLAPATKDSPATLNGAGNAFPLTGTGEHVYLQGGYLLPFQVGVSQFQPYFTLQMSSMKGLDQMANTWGLGLNWLVVGHYAKVTAHYQNRPIFAVDSDKKKTVSERKGEFIVQGQFAF